MPKATQRHSVLYFIDQRFAKSTLLRHRLFKFMHTLTLSREGGARAAFAQTTRQRANCNLIKMLHANSAPERLSARAQARTQRESIRSTLSRSLLHSFATTTNTPTHHAIQLLLLLLLSACAFRKRHDDDDDMNPLERVCVLRTCIDESPKISYPKHHHHHRFASTRRPPPKPTTSPPSAPPSPFSTSSVKLHLMTDLYHLYNPTPTHRVVVRRHRCQRRSSFASLGWRNGRVFMMCRHRKFLVDWARQHYNYHGPSRRDDDADARRLCWSVGRE